MLHFSGCDGAIVPVFRAIMDGPLAPFKDRKIVTVASAGLQD
jgi:hypothetical protein